MNFLYSDGPIIACSTSTHGNAAMAIIRISGFNDPGDFSAFFEKDLTAPIEPRRVFFTRMVLQGQLYDELCLTYFKAPHSYNGENILELTIHGNTLNIERIINLFVKHGGCRHAGPGEFTYRALRNKKLTLSQVEGLDLFLNASTGYALEQGLSFLSGELKDIYQDLYDLFIKHKSSLELSIDFSDDVGEETARKYFLETLDNFSKKFNQLAKRVAPMELNLVSPEIVLAGAPNSGKSSLFNFLLSHERAIVSSTPGTTRDYLTEELMIEGVKYRLVDTAGIRNADDKIESRGIEFTKKKLSKAFYSVLLINPFEFTDDLQSLMEHNFDLMLFTHSDLPGFETERGRVVKRFPELGSIGAMNTLALTAEWEKYFNQLVNKKYLEKIKNKPILFERHKSLILQSLSVLNNYYVLATTEPDVAILSQELNNLGHCISELLGIVSPDEVLQSVFSNFCIGK